MINLIKTIIAT